MMRMRVWTWCSPQAQCLGWVSGHDEDEGLDMMLTSSTMMRMRAWTWCSPQAQYWPWESGYDSHLKPNHEDESLDMMLMSSTMMRMRVWIWFSPQAQWWGWGSGQEWCQGRSCVQGRGGRWAHSSPKPLHQCTHSQSSNCCWKLLSFGRKWRQFDYQYLTFGTVV